MKIIMYCLFPILSILILFLLTKIMGYRQVTQLSMYDYIIGITLGSIASELSLANEDNVLKILLSMLIYGAVTFSLSKLTEKHISLRRFVEGVPIVVYSHNMIYLKALHKAKIDLDEFLMICRINNYFHLEDLEKIILETNGTFSFYPKEMNRPTVLKDLNKQNISNTFPIYLIKEGMILSQNFSIIHKDEDWLYHELKVKNIKIEDIFLLYYENNKINYYLKNEKESYFI